MARITRGNVVLHVTEEEVPHYLKLGYSSTTPMGKVVQSALPTDFGTLQKLYVEQKNENEALVAKVVGLEACVRELEDKLAAETQALKSAKAKSKKIGTESFSDKI